MKAARAAPQRCSSSTVPARTTSFWHQSPILPAGPQVKTRQVERNLARPLSRFPEPHLVRFGSPCRSLDPGHPGPHLRNLPRPCPIPESLFSSWPSSTRDDIDCFRRIASFPERRDRDRQTCHSTTARPTFSPNSRIASRARPSRTEPWTPTTIACISTSGTMTASP